MRIALKIAGALALGASLLFSAQAAFQIQRVTELHQREAHDDLLILARAVANATETLWRTAGQARARSYLQEVDERRTHTTIDLYLDVGSFGSGAASPRSIAKVHNGSLVARMPLKLPGGRRAAIELRRSLAAHSGEIRQAIWTQVALTIVLVLVFAGLSLAIGLALVRRRVTPLIDQARRVASGDFERNDDQHDDELGRLAREMNEMAAQLAASEKAIREERQTTALVLEQLRHADRLSTVGKIASAIAHELGTPLNVVAGRASMIAEGDDVQENARIISEQSARMAQIIRQLLDFARRKGLDKSNTNVGSLLEQARVLVEPVADRQGVSIVVEDASAIEAEIDSGKALQVLTNLMVNGVQAMPQGGDLILGATQKHVKAPPDKRAAPGDYVEIFVVDQGTGIGSEQREEIFKPFFTTKGAGEGTGLGLSVCDGIVREHEGWLDVRSSPGKGSRFSVFLPSGSAQEDSAAHGAAL